MSVTCITYTIVVYGRKLLAAVHCLPIDLDFDSVYHLAQGHNLHCLEDAADQIFSEAYLGNGLAQRVV